MKTREQALIIVPLIIGTLICIFAVIGYFVPGALGDPIRLGDSERAENYVRE